MIKIIKKFRWLKYIFFSFNIGIYQAMAEISVGFYKEIHLNVLLKFFLDTFLLVNILESKCLNRQVIK